MINELEHWCLNLVEIFMKGKMKKFCTIITKEKEQYRVIIEKLSQSQIRRQQLNEEYGY